MLRLLTIHEAVPGHYLQGVYANRCPSLVRSIFWSGLFAEGWAVYVTQVMMDVGYGADDPALLLTHWKFYLRCITNAIIDARIHTAGMTEDEAVALMVDGGFQEEAEARAKYDRARLSSTQLSTYFAGSMEMWDIELEARRRGGRRGHRPAARPARRVRGDTRVPLSRPPRGGHRPRGAADVAAAPDPVRLSVSPSAACAASVRAWVAPASSRRLRRRWPRRPTLRGRRRRERRPQRLDAIAGRLGGSQEPRRPLRVGGPAASSIASSRAAQARRSANRRGRATRRLPRC